MRVVRVAFGILIFTTAVAAGAAAQSKSQSDADLQEVANYRLTMAAVNNVASATRAMAAEMKKDPRFQGNDEARCRHEGAREQGRTDMLKELPKDVSAENVKFVEEHEAELAALQKEFQSLGSGGH